MKCTLLFVLTILSATAFAGEKYICTQIDGDEYAPKKMILTQVSDDTIHEGKFYPFKLEIFDGNSSKAIVSESVNVRTEDVMFKFTNTAKKVSGIIFLDEMDQSHVKVGKTEYRFNCN
jgi:hypothetical protein